MKKHIVFLLLSVVMVFPKTLSAQGYLESLVQDAIDEAVDEFKTSLWGSILDSEAQSEVKSRAKKLSEFTIDQSNKNEIQRSLGRYSLYDLNGQYSTVNRKLYGHIDKCFNNKHNLKFAELGEGMMPITMGNYRNSLLQTIEVNNLSDVLSKEALDTLSAIDSDGQLSRLLLKDIKDDCSLVGVFNNHPELLRTYKQLSKTDLRTQPSQIVYWGQTVKQFNDLIPSKSREKTVIPELLTFIQDNSFTKIYSKDEIIGSIKDNTIDCFHPDVANVVAMPNAEYRFPNITFKTDNLGRVVSVEGSFNPSGKGSSNSKPNMNPKVLEPLKSSDELVMSVAPALEGFGVPYCYLNMAYFKKTDSNKEAQKQMKQQLKDMKKQGVESAKIVSIIKYEDIDLKCSEMTTTIGNNEPCVFRNNQTVEEEIAQKQEKEQIRKEKELTKQEKKRNRHFERDAWETSSESFMMANIAYSIAPQASFGLTIGSVKKLGWYASFNGNFNGFINLATDYNMDATEYECDQTGTISTLTTEYSYSGDKATSRLGATAGLVYKINNPLSVYVGGGYGYRNVFWKLDSGQWVKCADDSYQGVTIDAGLIYSFGEIGLSLGVQTIGVKYLEAKIGIGFTIKN